MDIRNPRRNFMFVFYSEAADSYWVMPSLELIREATSSKGGINVGKHRIVFTNTRTDGFAYPRPRFNSWKDNWDAFRVMAGELAST
jgi:hypothetical protein